jgi:DNA/RNA endonuclease YhcR with UshA esterase domain
MNWVAGLVASALLAWASAAYADPVSPEEAVHHVGESATVCGMVASAKFAANSRSQPTFLNLDRPYPNHVFTVVIFGSDRAKFGTPEILLRGKRICVTGQISDYHGKPEVVLTDPSQLTQ